MMQFFKINQNFFDENQMQNKISCSEARPTKVNTLMA